jgi:hypothetical protein
MSTHADRIITINNSHTLMHAVFGVSMSFHNFELGEDQVVIDASDTKYEVWHRTPITTLRGVDASNYQLAWSMQSNTNKANIEYFMTIYSNSDDAQVSVMTHTENLNAFLHAADVVFAAAAVEISNDISHLSISTLAATAA